MSTYSKPDELLPTVELFKKTLPPKICNAYTSTFPLMIKYFDARPVTNTMGTQNALGFNWEAKTTQDGLPIYQRTNAVWFKTKEEMKDPREQTAALA